MDHAIRSVDTHDRNIDAIVERVTNHLYPKTNEGELFVRSKAQEIILHNQQPNKSYPPTRHDHSRGSSVVPNQDSGDCNTETDTKMSAVTQEMIENAKQLLRSTEGANKVLGYTLLAGQAGLREGAIIYDLYNADPHVLDMRVGTVRLKHVAIHEKGVDLYGDFVHPAHCGSYEYPGYFYKDGRIELSSFDFFTLESATDRLQGIASHFMYGIESEGKRLEKTLSDFHAKVVEATAKYEGFMAQFQPMIDTLKQPGK